MCTPDRKINPPSYFEKEIKEPILYKCDCCHEEVEEINKIDIQIKEEIVKRSYCDYCLNELLKETLKRV